MNEKLNNLFNYIQMYFDHYIKYIKINLNLYIIHKFHK